MKKFLFTVSLFFFLSVTSQAQSLENGLRLYQEGDYERALRIFDDFDDPIAYLFSGKSHFSLGNFVKAKHFLAQVDSTSEDLYWEANYTSALADFQLENYADALDILYQIKENPTQASVRRTAITFYFQLLNYLAPGQRIQAFRATQYDDVRLDLVKSSIGKVDYSSAVILLNAYKKTVHQPNEDQVLQLENMLQDSAAYNQNFSLKNYPEAPEGIAYNLGVAIPQFDVESPNFEISRNLYLGIQLAVEEFNSDNNDKKVFISYKNTHAEPADAQKIVNEFAWIHNTDAIIGPMFSEVAVEFSKFAEAYQIPLITPLANADNLNLDHNYTFQLNPAFGIHGKTMARYAFYTLGYDTVAVIADKGSLGEPAAKAFRNEARELGMEVVKYYSKNLESQGFDISEFTTFLDPESDTLTNYKIDAIYAPFTGQAASTLMGSLLTHLEALQNNSTILGLEEWESISIEERNLPQTALYYTKNFIQTSDVEKFETFQSAYRLRFDMEPDFYAMIGYDAANLLLQTFKKVQNPAYLREGLKSIVDYKGLISEISFEDTHVNQDVKVVSRLPAGVQ